MMLQLAVILSLLAFTHAVVRITSEELYDGMQTGRWDVVIDVRSLSEWEGGHIANATFLEDLNQFGSAGQKSSPADLSGCEDCVIAVYCFSGRRAGEAARLLEANGFRKPVYNGLGISQWTGAGYSLVSIPSRSPLCTITNQTCTPSDIPIVLQIDLFRAITFGQYDLLIDIRSKAEWDQGHLPNATHVERLDLFGTTSQITSPADLGACNQSCSIAVYDADGGAQAAVVAQILIDYGFNGPIHNAQGVKQWTPLYDLVNTTSDDPPCKTSMSSCMSISRSKVINITSEEVFEGMQRGHFDAVIDVRGQSEWDEGHLPNATLVENLNVFGISDFGTNPYTLGQCQFNGCHIVTYCTEGTRAAIAANLLLDAGFQGIIYNGQGVEQWQKAGYALVNTTSVVPPCVDNGTMCRDYMEAPSPAPTTDMSGAGAKQRLLATITLLTWVHALLL